MSGEDAERQVIIDCGDNAKRWIELYITHIPPGMIGSLSVADRSPCETDDDMSGKEELLSALQAITRGYRAAAERVVPSPKCLPDLIEMAKRAVRWRAITISGPMKLIQACLESSFLNDKRCYDEKDRELCYQNIGKSAEEVYAAVCDMLPDARPGMTDQ
jgi:hypothetical protein